MMTATEDPNPAIVVRIAGLGHAYGATKALDRIDLTIGAGRLMGLIGPDGVGKSTLLGLIAGSRKIQAGTVTVLGGDMGSAAHREAICRRVAYMPQGLGKNLYPDLSVRENIEFFARLFGQSAPERAHRLADLLDATDLTAFVDRLARNLSGGMRQKLGLCCALVHDPDLLVLDEPTTGVDPLSRRQFWDLIARLRAQRPGMTVIVATAYMEEAARFEGLLVMNAGRILATGTPDEIRARTGQASLEDSFIALLPPSARIGRAKLVIPPRRDRDDEPAIVAQSLTRRFGDFLAVEDVSFTIARGEIFGFLGSNGCGKTTTMKMLTGLLPVSSGQAWLFGQPINARDLGLRYRVGYMSQSFSLYTELTVRQNLRLHARLFHMPGDRMVDRLAELTQDFGLSPYLDQAASDLPLGIRQRLALAVAIIHAPDLLILDEPTSGVDPLARDQFWALLIDLSRNKGVTIFVSTHFMNEAARCDRVSLMHAGRTLATGSPAELTTASDTADLEGAFIAYLEAATAHRQPRPLAAILPGAASAWPHSPRFSLRRLLAYSIREGLELLRDPVRLWFALLGTVFLMLVFGFGISTDVNHLSFAVLDRDQSPESISYLKAFRGSSYFVERPPLADYAALERRMANGELRLAIEIPHGFGRDVRARRPVEVAAWADGAMPFRAETTRGYLLGVHQTYLIDLAIRHGISPQAAATIETRFRYNQDFNSANSLVPATIALQLALFPAILMALAVVREKELGSIINLYVTPVTRFEFIIGKQMPYVLLALVNFICLFAMAVLIFQVPLKGSFATLALGALIYVFTTTGYGLVISAFARTQIAALFGTAILTVIPAIQFAGMLVPVSSLDGPAIIIGRAFPMSYFLPISVGTFTKSLGLAELGGMMLALAAFVPILTVLSILLLRRQER